MIIQEVRDEQVKPGASVASQQALGRRDRRETMLPRYIAPAALQERSTSLKPSVGTTPKAEIHVVESSDSAHSRKPVQKLEGSVKDFRLPEFFFEMSSAHFDG